MNKLQASITFQHRVKEAQTIQQQNENVVEPITPIINDLEIQKENDNEINKHFQILDWDNLINSWEQLLTQERIAEEHARIDLNDDLDIEIDDILLNQTHPALDIEAKWQIKDIFISDLGVPFVINELNEDIS